MVEMFAPGSEENLETLIVVQSATQLSLHMCFLFSSNNTVLLSSSYVMICTFEKGKRKGETERLLYSVCTN